MKKYLGIIVFIATIFCVCACSAENDGQDDGTESVTFPSIYINSMEEDFDVTYNAGKNFRKNVDSIEISNDEISKNLDIYNDKSETTLECGVGFDTEDGCPEKATNFTKMTFNWDDGTSDTFDCDITFQPDNGCENWISSSITFDKDGYQKEFESPVDGEYNLSDESKEMLDKVGIDYSLVNKESKTVFKMKKSKYDMIKMDLILECKGKPYVLAISY